MINIPGLNLENIFLVFFSYVLILLVNRKTASESAVLFIAILTFHHIVAYIYAFYLNAPQNEVDPAGFVRLASECTNFGYCGFFGEHLYANYLAKMLSLGNSIYFVYLLNVLFFVISLYYFIGISNFFCLNRYRKISIFFYSMWPSVIYFTTLHYREPFELYLLIVAVFFGLTGSKSDSFLRMLVSMFFLLAMGVFHMKGLIYLSPLLFLVLITYQLPMTFFSLAKKILLLVIMCTAVYSSQIMSTEYLDEVWQSKQKVNNLADSSDSQSVKKREKVLTGDRLIFENNKNIYLSEKAYPDIEPGYIDTFMRKVTYYRASLTWVTEPNTAFLSTISDKSLPAFAATYILVYLEYLISPFVFQVNSFHSFLAYGESVMRLLLLASSLLLLRRCPQIRVLILIYVLITAMWAIGVISFGAAIRHHIQTNWILVLLGVPMITEYIRGRFQINNK